MYGECWFTGTFYFKHGGSQNATLKQLLNEFIFKIRKRVMYTLVDSRKLFHVVPEDRRCYDVNNQTLQEFQNEMLRNLNKSQ